MTPRPLSLACSIWELSLGPQWKRTLAGGGQCFGRVGLEAQYWQGVGNFSTEAGNNQSLAGNLGLAGFSLAFGLTR